jgi:hypothetical protein
VEIRQLIRTMRIQGELLKLGIDVGQTGRAPERVGHAERGKVHDQKKERAITRLEDLSLQSY